MAAWRGLDTFEGRASLRTWLYRIATNACLGALRRTRPAREIPPPPGATRRLPAREPHHGRADLARAVPRRVDRRPAWLGSWAGSALRQPRGDRAGVRGRAPAIEPTRARRGGPQGRAGLSRRRDRRPSRHDRTSRHSALQRARDKLDWLSCDRRALEAPLAGSRWERDLVSRFAGAFESGDVGAVVALLSEDARLTMPPEPMEYVGRPEIHRFLSTVPARGELQRFKLVATRANGQPAFGCYLRTHEGPLRAYGLMVLTLGRDRIVAITGFPDTSVVASFGLPRDPVRVTLRRDAVD
jgi:hypothetical protein